MAFSENKRFKETGAKFNQLMENVRGGAANPSASRASGLHLQAGIAPIPPPRAGLFRHAGSGALTRRSFPALPGHRRGCSHVVPPPGWRRVEAVLRPRRSKEAEKRRSSRLEKELELEFDLGKLAGAGPQPRPPAAAALRGSPRRERTLLRALARDNTQLLVSRLWELPADAPAGAGAAWWRGLPPSPNLFRLPREKPSAAACPAPPTRWEQFARLKGIRAARKTSLVWDEQAKEWRRAAGATASGGDPARAWLAEVPAGRRPRGRTSSRGLRREKRERVGRNELNRLRNLARAHRAGSDVPAAPLNPLHPTGHQDREELRRVAPRPPAGLHRLTRRLQPRLPNGAPRKRASRSGGRKRRLEPLLGHLAAERSRKLELLRDMGSKKPVLDITRAVNKQMRQEEAEAAAAHKGKKQSQRGKRGRRQQRRRQQRPGRSGKKSGARRQQQQQKPAGGTGGGRRKSGGRRKKA
ncbi:LOW QUALITY PROTEIN: ribosome biogenesis regulatory protein homolog [Manacus vitellinus]|uniref:LOW QUALITY PROTEIN: ribosome biogenesis regulatory protein homolog n=1 Tax=Manacus vitellinus TaxID=328815 RepID=UPI00115D232D|nr:LOW QUALITY PROTEIN: ribosome biogenesis regulatory protein homolog [Manacus vitellinus]